MNTVPFLFVFFRLILLMTSVLLVRGQQLDQFAEDLMKNMARTKPAFVFNPDETQLWKWAHSQSSALMSATGYWTISDHLQFLIENGDVDIIFFFTSGQGEFIRKVVNNLEILKSKITVVIPFGESSGLQSRLNSHLYLYKMILGGGMTLFESYQIR